MKACRQGRDSCQRKSVLNQKNHWSRLELQKRDRATLVPSDDRIELILDFSLLLGKHAAANSTVHIAEEVWYRILVQRLERQLTKDISPWWIQLRKCHQRGKPPQALLCHRKAHFPIWISQTKGRRPCCSAVGWFGRHVNIGNVTALVMLLPCQYLHDVRIILQQSNTDVVPSFANSYWKMAFLWHNRAWGGFPRWWHFRSWIHHGEMSFVNCLSRRCTRIRYQTSSAICTVLLAAACFPRGAS